MSKIPYELCLGIFNEVPVHMFTGTKTGMHIKYKQCNKDMQGLILPK